MKIFQILNGLCHYDATPIHPTLEDTVGKYTPDIVFVEAPNYVFEGWGYDDEAEGDARFIQPTAPEGWIYNTATGAFIPLNPETPEKKTSEIKLLKAQVEALSEQNEMLEECLVELAQAVYA